MDEWRIYGPTARNYISPTHHRWCQALGKPCPSLILAAPSGTVAMAFGRRLYALETRKAAWVTDMCTVLYELE
jgi:hypothetical protein